MGEYAEARKTLTQGLRLGNSRSSFEQLLAINDSIEASHRQTKGN
jgi:hypothetical protein